MATHTSMRAGQEPGAAAKPGDGPPQLVTCEFVEIEHSALNGLLGAADPVFDDQMVCQRVDQMVQAGTATLVEIGGVLGCPGRSTAQQRIEGAGRNYDPAPTILRPREGLPRVLLPLTPHP